MNIGKRSFLSVAPLRCARLGALLGMSLLVMLGGALAVDPVGERKPPGGVPVFAAALAHFDLQIPVAAGTSVVDIKTLTSDPMKGFLTEPGYGKFFWVAGGSQMVFFVPPDGATTPNSHFPRTELAQKQSERWKVNSGNHVLRGTFSLISVPKVTDKGEITLAQIHDNDQDNGPLLKLICDYKARPWKLHADYRSYPKKSSDHIMTPDRQRESIALNSAMEYEVSLSSTRVLTVKVRKAGTQSWRVLADSSQKGQSLDPAWDGETCYFKAGCYMFDPGPAGTPPGEVHYTGLAVE